MNDKYDSKYKVRDPIYGFIEFDSQEKEIISSPHFQRLRRIKQLALTDMVYPGANHTRFEHSLGVMQMASDIFDNLVKDKENWDKLHLDESSKIRIRKILRLAALLHDTGHAPFSHAGEDTMPPLPKSHSEYQSNSEKVKKYEHEDYSIACIKYLFRDIIEGHPMGQNHNISAEEITFLLGDNTVKPRRNLLTLRELISGQIDADRADYLLRDSLHLGVNYGIYDRNRLTQCITIGLTESDSPILAIEEGGWHMAESLVMARYQMFSQVYFHKTRRIFDYHAGEALKSILNVDKMKDGVFPPPTSIKNVQKYLDYDDWKVYGALKAGKGGKHGEYILNRNHYKCIQSWENALKDDDYKLIQELEKKYSDVEHFLDKNVVTKWYKLDKDIMIFNKRTKLLYPLSYKSQFIRSIGQPEVTRFYIVREKYAEENGTEVIK